MSYEQDYRKARRAGKVRLCRQMRESQDSTEIAQPVTLPEEPPTAEIVEPAEPTDQ